MSMIRSPVPARPTPRSRIEWKTIGIPVVLIGIHAGSAWGQQAPAIEEAERAFAQAQRIGERVGTELWDRSLQGPMIFVDRSTRRAVANRPDTLGVLEEVDGVWVGVLPDDVTVANTGVNWAGRRWTMLMWPLPYGRYDRAVLMAHEMFHRIQDDLGLPASSPPNEHLDRPDARLWLRLEWRALREALLAEGEARETAVEDALAFRARRHALYPDGVSEEIALEENEGLAEYTGFRASGLPDWAQRARAAFQLDEHDARARRNPVVRNFAYASGPAYGLLLDEADPGWRDGLRPGTDQGRLLASAYGVSPAPSEAEARGQRYGFAPLSEEETRRESERLARQAEYRRRFVDGPVLVLPASPDVRYSFDPNRVEPFDEGGTVYDLLNVRDDWGSLKVAEGGAWMIREDGRVARVVVPLPESAGPAPTEGDGWILELAEGWTLKSTDEPGSWTVAER